MKKKYITPLTVAMKVESQGHLLFGSGNGENTINGGGNRGDYTDRQLGREYDWDED